MNARPLVALGFLSLVGGATVWKLTRPDPHARKADEVTLASVPSLDPGSIDELELKEPKKPRVVLRKDGDTWNLVEPVKDRADAEMVKSALDGLKDMKVLHVVAENPASHAQLGVTDEEAIRVTARHEGKDLADLRIGDRGNVRLGDAARVYATRGIQVGVFTRETRFWRDRVMARFEPDEVERLEVASDGDRIVLRRVPPPAAPKETFPPPQATWEVIEGQAVLDGKLDPATANGTVSMLSRLSGNDVAPDVTTPEGAGLVTPRTTSMAVLKGGRRVEVRLGSKEEDLVYAQIAGTPRIWLLGAMEADVLGNAPLQYRSKALVSLEPTDVQRIELTRGTERIVAVREADVWKALEPAGLKFDSGKVDGLVREFARLSANSIMTAKQLPAATASLAKPTAKAVIVDTNGGQTTLIFGQPRDGQYAVRVTGRKEVFSFASVLERLFKPASELELPEMPAMPAIPGMKGMPVARPGQAPVHAPG